MPLYDLRCTRCEKVWEYTCHLSDLNSLPKCECGGEAQVLITNSRTQDWFKPHINENFTGEPIEVRSRSHLKQLCEQHGMVSRALGDHRNLKEI
jgi:putative FmdB family regulatory protein